MSQGHFGTVDMGHGTGHPRPLAGSGTSHPIPSVQGKQPERMTALHVAALNLIQDHEAGIEVSPARLKAARQLLGRAA